MTSCGVLWPNMVVDKVMGGSSGEGFGWLLGGSLRGRLEAILNVSCLGCGSDRRRANGVGADRVGANHR